MRRAVTAHKSQAGFLHSDFLHSVASDNKHATRQRRAGRARRRVAHGVLSVAGPPARASVRPKCAGRREPSREASLPADMRIFHSDLRCVSPIGAPFARRVPPRRYYARDGGGSKKISSPISCQLIDEGEARPPAERRSELTVSAAPSPLSQRFHGISGKVIRET